MIQRARKRDEKVQEKRDAKKKELKKMAYKKGGKSGKSKWIWLIAFECMINQLFKSVEWLRLIKKVSLIIKVFHVLNSISL